MNREQQEVFALLKEIDEICGKYQIPCFLSPQLALRAYMKRPFSRNPLTGTVVMKTGDMEKFRRAFEREKTPGRALESMVNNPSFPGFYLRYENRNTTCYCLHAGDNFAAPGFGINILPLRGTGRREKMLKALETGWQESCYSYGVEETVSSLMQGALMGILTLQDRKAAGQMLYRLFVRERKYPADGQYVLKTSRTEEKTYPADLFDRTARLELEGYSFSVPENVTRYLRISFGERFAQIPAGVYRNNYTVITSAEVGCEEFLRESGSRNKLLRDRRRQYLLDTPVRKTRENFEAAWDHIKLYGAGSEMKTRLNEKKEFILHLYESRDLIRLEGVFRPYTRWIRRCLEKGEYYPLDPEMMQLYLQVLDDTGQGELACLLREKERERG